MSKQYGILNNELVVTNFKDFINGRLTLTNGIPIDFTDKVAQGTLYFTPYKGNKISLYDTTNLIWRVYTFSQISLSLFGIVQDKNYDVFVLYNNGTLALELSQAWTDDTTRANSLVLQDGVYVKSGSLNKLWLGTIRASANNVCENSASIIFISNYYNTCFRPIKKISTDAGYIYTTQVWRSAKADDTFRIKVLSCIDTNKIFIKYTCSLSPSNGRFCCLGIAKNRTNGDDSTTNNSMYHSTGAGEVFASAYANYEEKIGLGYFYFQAIEYGDGLNSAFYPAYGGQTRGGICGKLEY